MIAIVFVLTCWAVFFLSPHNVSMLVLDKDAIMAGEWWRLWTAQLAHFKISQLIMNSAIIILMGLIVERFAKVYQVLLALLVAMPLMAALMILLIPELSDYRGAYGVAAMLTMMGVWFLILEARRFSRGYWAGIVLFLLFLIKVSIETLSVFSPSVAYHLVGTMRVDWLMQCAGILIGLVVFNALHQIHTTSAYNQKQKERRVAGTAAMAAAAQRRKVRK